MAKLQIGDRVVEIAPYKIAQLRRAAPILDQINARMAEIAGKPEGVEDKLNELGVAGMTEVVGLFLAFIAVGTEKSDAKLTAEALEEQFGIGDLPALQATFRDICTEQGMNQSGEATAPTG
jgi:hypothetical protein